MKTGRLSYTKDEAGERRPLIALLTGPRRGAVVAEVVPVTGR